MFFASTAVDSGSDGWEGSGAGKLGGHGADRIPLSRNIQQIFDSTGFNSEVYNSIKRNLA